ncbi:MAG TPA: PRC-barrel domain containing protein [Pseudonocardiaceae bacterium]|nr:PRC-barrel domain containing protein [Pseudonocardiaceae bacterium]
MDLGQPIAYLVLKVGTPVYDRNTERIGVVEHVLAEEDLDIFHGLIVRTRPLPGRHLFADADQIAELRERGVLLSVDRDELHEPKKRNSTRQRHPDDRVESPLQARLRRAWDWLNSRV